MDINKGILGFWKRLIRFISNMQIPTTMMVK